MLIPAGRFPAAPAARAEWRRRFLWRQLGRQEGGTLDDRDAWRGNDTIELGGSEFREMRIGADARAAGFTTVPDVKLQFDPVQIAARYPFTPIPPRRRAGGGGERVSAPLTLIPCYVERAEDALPLVNIMVQTETFTLAAGAGDADASRRALVLWGLLLLGTLALSVWSTS